MNTQIIDFELIPVEFMPELERAAYVSGDIEKAKMKTTVLLIRERIEVPCMKHGKPSYRWTNGYYVCDPAKDNAKIYPPVVRSEAYALARDIAGNNCKIVIEG